MVVDDINEALDELVVEGMVAEREVEARDGTTTSIDLIPAKHGSERFFAPGISALLKSSTANKL